MRLQAEVAARLLLQDYRKAHPDWSNDKIPVDELVTWLGLNVATFYPLDYPQGTYGFIDPDEDENLIWLCRELPETLHRFTLAHELGHIILHCHGGRRFQELVLRFSTNSRLITQTTLQTIQQSMPDLSRIDPCHDMDVQADMTGYLDEDNSSRCSVLVRVMIHVASVNWPQTSSPPNCCYHSNAYAHST